MLRRTIALVPCTPVTEFLRGVTEFLSISDLNPVTEFLRLANLYL